MIPPNKVSDPARIVIESQNRMTPKNTEAVRILHVEDDPVSGRLVKAIAEKEGFVLDVVGTERECWKAISEDPPQLFLLDLSLPDGSGLELLSKLREKPHPRAGPAWPAVH